MTFGLYDATIPSFRQLIGTMAVLIEKAEAHCNDHGLPHGDVIGARLIETMLPFSYQIKSTAEHSIGAIRGIRAGVFSPSLTTPPDSFAGLSDIIATAAADLAALSRDEVDGFIGQDMQFAFKTMQIPFTAENFLLSFAQPNFYFHATTAYDVLRMKGVAIGKTVFLGALRAKG